MKMERGFVWLVLLAGKVWLLLILVVFFSHIWSCQSSYVFFSGFLFDLQHFVAKKSKYDNTMRIRGLICLEVHCGFMHNGGAEMDPVDVNYVKKCSILVASGIFNGYDVPHQPSNFLTLVDEVSLNLIKENATVKKDKNGGQWIGVWYLVLLQHAPYEEARRKEKVPKILTHYFLKLSTTPGLMEKWS